MEVIVQRQFVKMSKGQKLRALVNERLTAVAEEIFELFERTIAEYEEEVFRSKGRNNRRPQPQPLGPVSVEPAASRRAGVQVVSTCQKNISPLEPENPESFYIKEDPDLCIKQEEEQLPFTVVSVKIGEKEDMSSVLHQIEEKGVENNGDSDEQTDSSLDIDHTEDWTQKWASPSSSSAVQMETGGHSSNAILIIDTNLEGTAQTIRPHAFSYSDIAGLVDSNDKMLLNDSSVTDKVKSTKLHKCAECGKGYLHKPSLFRHILTHKEQKPFKCSVCQKGFSQKPHLTAHMRIHTGEKPFSCPFCSRSFSNKSNVRQHLRVHTGEKPFPCSVCNMRFRCTKTLTTHMTVHSGERPFGCTDCDARFKQQASLEAHMRTHSGEKPFSCPFCERCFSQRRSLKKHLKSHTEQEKPGDAEVELVSVQAAAADEPNEGYITVSI